MNTRARSFGGDSPLPHLVYERTRTFCGEQLNKVGVCDKAADEVDANEGRSFAKKMTRCGVCRAVAHDIYGVVRRQREHQRYRSREHIHPLLDEVCTDMQFRHPRKVGERMMESCADLLADYESEVAETLMGGLDEEFKPGMLEEAFCGSEMSGQCRSFKKEVHRSPWFQVPRSEEL